MVLIQGLSRLAVAMGIALLSMAGAGAAAQTFKTAPVRITTVFPSGSGPDVVARADRARCAEVVKRVKVSID